MFCCTQLNSTTREDLQHALDQAQASKKPDMQKLTIFYKDAVKERPLTVKYGEDSWHGPFDLTLVIR